MSGTLKILGFNVLMYMFLAVVESSGVEGSELSTIIYYILIFGNLGFFISSAASGLRSLEDKVENYVPSDKAYITLPDGENIDLKIDSWERINDGEQIVVTSDGRTYTVDADKITLELHSQD